MFTRETLPPRRNANAPARRREGEAAGPVSRPVDSGPGVARPARPGRARAAATAWRALLAALLLGLAACASVPTALRGDFPDATPKDAVGERPHGEAVRWGGEILRVDPQADETCFEILGTRLDIHARPRLRSESQGRFIACSDGFFDPEVYVRGREVTVTGRYSATETRKVGEFDYVYPLVDADTIYLWPHRTYYPRAYGGLYYDPFWYGGFGWGYGFGPYWGPGFGPPPVIIVPGGGHHHERPPPRPRPPPPPPPHRDP